MQRYKGTRELNYRVLSNGNKIPPIGYGTDIAKTWRSANSFPTKTYMFIKQYAKSIKNSDKRSIKIDKTLPRIIRNAPQCNCNLFDTARAYGGSEYVLGRELKKNFSRDSYYIVTKLSNFDQRERTVEEALRISLDELALDYVDLYLIHWPQTETYIKSWKGMEEVYAKGLCKAIGVCNCNIHHLEAIKKGALINPMVNQFECHPLFTQEKLREYCHINGIQVMAYTPTGRMDFRLKRSKKLEIISSKYNKSLAQIILRWHIQINNIPIVNTTSLEHLIDNMNIFDFELSAEDVKLISSLNVNSRLRYDPDNCDFDRL
ncbi:aldo/keto reductase family protein [Aminipila luticellarii]|uniref:Aldo/keto reductase n=1 Tax=Aminipila luticellarii TaxID=2507160 RepID=A0A410PSP7_9FIRM|nr:aldo/keto reductase [Aminipila luticellarii]QAT42011.1 aldo/keto reductase [Aminipila luticellarii]